MIDVKIKATSKEIIGSKKKVYDRSLPENWDEIDSAKSIELYSFLLIKHPIISKLHILKFLLNLPDQIFYNLPPLVILELCDLIDWMDKDKSSAQIESFTHNGTKFFFPKPKFQNGVAKEWPMADTVYQKAIDQNDDKHLIRLLAIICREEEPDLHAQRIRGDRRVKLEYVDHRAELLKDVAPEIRLAALMYWSKTKASVHKMYGDWIFEIPEEDEDDIDEELDEVPGQNGPMFGWWSTYFLLAREGTFGTYDQVCNTNFHTICMYLVDKKKEQQDQERRDALNNLRNQD